MGQRTASFHAPAGVYAALAGRGGLAELGFAVTAPDAGEPGEFRSLNLCGEGEVRIVDVWFVSAGRLRLRIDAAEANELRLDFYQCDGARDFATVLAGRHAITRAGIDFVAVDLFNPFLPLMIVLARKDGTIRQIDVVPFPSLCRGGPHFAELCALGASGRYIDDLRALSDALLREHLAQAPSRTIGAVRGGIASTETREWLRHIFALSDAPAQDRLTLHLPAGSLPTLSALTTRRPLLAPDAAQASGSFVTSDLQTSAPPAMVAMPPLPEWLDDLQPRNAERFYPVVTRYGATNAQTESPASDIPLAVKFAAPPQTDEMRRLFPTARDAAGPILRSAVVPPRLVSIVIAGGAGSLTDLANLINSLATQTWRDIFEIVLVGNPAIAPFREAVARLLELAFPGRHRILDGDAAADDSARIALGAAEALGEFLVVASGDMVLIDPRTIETLVTLADRGDVATASCLLLRDGEESEPVLVNATYPVAANSSSLFAARTENWRRSRDDAQAKGMIHLFTTAIVASCGSVPAPVPETGSPGVVMRRLGA